MRQHNLILIVFFIYILAVTILMIFLGVSTYPDRYFFILIIPAFFIHKIRSFLLDWIPFLLIFFSYEFLRGLAEHLNNRVNYQVGISFDSLLSNPIPTIALQQRFFHTGSLQWYDYLASFIYFLHFVIPLTFAFLLWLKYKDRFRRFVIGFLGLSYAGLITYIAFPAAPPWLASLNGYTGPVTKVLDLALRSFPDKLHLPTIYSNFDPNQVAAIPSLHAAYPFLIFLFARKWFGKWAYGFLVYTLAVWISIVYLGEHYVLDILAGVAYSIPCYLLAVNINLAAFNKYLPTNIFHDKKLESVTPP